MKLVSMINFVYSLDDNSHTVLGDAFKYCLVREYANFLNQPLNLGMFVPAIEVNGKWEVLEEPTENEKNEFGGAFSTIEEQAELYSKMKKFQQAKDRVLFEGFEVEVGIVVDYATFNHSRGRTKIMLNNKTINDLIKYAPTLTAKGQELSGLNK